MLDFYGTVVHEDDPVADEICDVISRTSPGDPAPAAIATYWADAFCSACGQSFGPSFQNQRTLELGSLEDTVHRFRSDCDPFELADKLFDRWQRPPLFEDARRFLARVGLPVVVVSNIDRRDIEAAIGHHDLVFDGVFTSEDLRAYKPRSEPFEAAMAALGTRRVLHVGDSQSSDVLGASELGLAVAWVNRKGVPATDGPSPDHQVRDLEELLPILLG